MAKNFEVKEIKKRDGRVVPFDHKRIAGAIFKAFRAVGNPNEDLAEKIALIVAEKLDLKYKGSKKEVPTIEEIQDLVEETLIEQDHARIAKAYILYREKRWEIRLEKQKILDKTEIDEVDKKFDASALRVLKSRYLRKDSSGKVIESPKELFTRVAVHASLPNIIHDKKISKKETQNISVSFNSPLKAADFAHLEGKLKIGKYILNKYHIDGLHKMFLRLEAEKRNKCSWDNLVQMLKQDSFKAQEKIIDDFYSVMVEKHFLPNTPAIANFGNPLGMGSACFALEIKDSIDSIMDTLKKASIVFKAGGGLGYNFSHLREEGGFIKTTGGTSSGPIIFMRLFDTMTEVIKQGGIRRGANMGIMNSDHPDIEKFVTAKTGNKALKNFNISVFIKANFWDYYRKNEPYPLISPNSGEITGYISPKLFLDKIAYQAWESGEPGVIFEDRVNDYNPFLKDLGPIETTNPCGEVLLYPNESCNLGSINVWSFVKKNDKGKKEIDWGGLEKTIKIAVRFLDNVIDVNVFPLAEIQEMSLKTRKIGLGIMGIANLLYDLEIQFNSNKGREVMGQIAEFVNYHSKKESVLIAKERGYFPYYGKSFYGKGRLPFSGFDDKKLWTQDWGGLVKEIKKYGLRNSYTTVIAPTGSISMIAGCSSGIEPVFSLAFEKSVSVGSFYYIDPVFEKVTLGEGLFDEMLIRDVVNNSGSVAHIPYIPPKIKKFFVTAHDITAEDHVKTLSVFQRWVDSSISKTNNFPFNATVEDVKKSYMLAYELGCKAVTVFRDKSIQDQVLTTTGKDKKQKEKEGSIVKITDEKVESVAIYSSVNSLNSGEINNGGNGKPTHCPTCKVLLSHKEGCTSCLVCGWGLCS